MSFSRKMTKKSKKWRGALIYLALFGVAPLAFGAETRYVSNYDELSSAISEFNANTGEDYKIVLKNGINLAGTLPVITGNDDLVGVDSGSLEIVGSGFAINGNNEYRGLIVDSQKSGAKVKVSNLEFASCHATGGAGGVGAGGGGGGMGGGAAIYANSGEIVLSDVTTSNSSAQGGAGGSILHGSESYGGGGGIGGNGGNGVIAEAGAANGGGILTDGADSTPSRNAGDGGVTSTDNPDSFGRYVDMTTPVGGASLSGGGGGASVAVGGDGGFGGGGGAGGTIGGDGGFGGGGAGGADALTAGLGGFGAGNGGYVEPVKSENFSDTQGGGTGGGGAALGAAIFVGENANVTVAVSEDSVNGIYGGTLTGGIGGGGTAEDGEAIGKGIFLLNDLTIEVAEGGEYRLSDNIGGYAGSSRVNANPDGSYANTSGITKTGEGTLVLEAADSSYTGDTTVREGTLVAAEENAISAYSNLNVEGGTAQLNADQSVKGLSGGAEARVDLNASTLSVTGDSDSAYAGSISGNGRLLKQGTGTLALSGDSRDEESEVAFDTEIQNGTIRVENEGAFGDGVVYYTRTDENDQTPAIEFGGVFDIPNDIVLSGNSVPMILSGTSATLSGQLTNAGSAANEIELRLDAGSTLAVSNTGVSRDDDGNVVIDKLNGIHAYTLTTGNLSAKVTSFLDTSGEEDIRYWYSSIGNAPITNQGDNTLSFILETDDVDAGLNFANNFILSSGNLTIGQSFVEDEISQVNKIVYSGSTSGDGGLIIDIGDGATMYATGSFGHASTVINSGILDITELAGSIGKLGELSGDGGVINTGSKDLVVNFDDSEASFSGKITGDEGTTIFKDGTGSWTLNLTNDSNVNAIRILDGTFSLGEKHYDDGLYQSNDFEIEIQSGGRFSHSTVSGATLVLNNLIASAPGGALEIGENDELILSSQNTSTDLSANLVGSGWLFLENVTGDDGKVTPWVLGGDNSEWAGTIALYDNNAQLTLASEKAGSENSSVNFGALGTLNVDESTVLGTLDFDNNLTINAASGKMLTLNGLSSSVQWLDDSVLTIDGGGAVAFSEGSGGTYYGETLVTNGSALVLFGDNTADAEYGAYRRATTLTNGGALVMDYSNEDLDGTWTSLWGSDIDIDGEGTIAIQDVVKVKEDEDGEPSYYVGTVEFNDDINFIGEDSNELTFQVNNSYAVVELHSAIEGLGDLTKTGAGKLILNGSGDFGSAMVNSGILQLGTSETSVNDQLANSAVTISGGALAGWTDSLGSVQLRSGVLNILKTGTVYLNDSENALTMDGGTMYVNVLDADNYTNYKTTEEDATVALKGGAIYVDTSASEVELDSGTTLTIVETGEGNLTADPSDYIIYDDIAGKRFIVDPESISNGKFKLLLKTTQFSEIARSPNERVISRHLDDWLDSGSVDSETNEFLGQLENAIDNNPRVLNQLTGELRFSTFKAQVHAHNFIRQTLTQNVIPDSTAGIAPHSFSAIRGQAYEERDGFSGWISALAAFGDADPHNGTAGYDFDLLGGVVGVEVGSTAANQFGLYFAYSNTQLDTNRAMGNVKVNEEQFGAYLRFSDPYGYTFATGSIGITDYDVARALSVANYSNLYYKGSTDGWSGNVYLERGFTFSLPGSDLQPYGGLQYTHLHADDYNESGSLDTLSIKTDESNYDSLEGILGIRWVKSTLLGARQFDFNAYTNWTHEFLDASPDGFISLAGRPDGSIRIIGNSVGRDWIYAGIGGKLYGHNGVSVFGGADVQVNDYTAYVNGHAGLSCTW